jgi:hypothetical protein
LIGVLLIERNPMMDRRPGGGEDDRGEQHLTLHLDEFARRATEEECARLGVSARELATFALLYYLADIDSGRIARRLPGPEGHT